MKNVNNITLQSLSEKVGVSVSTVSRVLNGQAQKFRIAKKTQEKIIKTAKELGYAPNQVARGLRLKKTFTLGYIIPDISNPFFSSIARSVERSARKLGYSVIVSDTEESTIIESQTLKLFFERKLDGLILSPVGENVEHINSIVKEAVKSGLDIVTAIQIATISTARYFGLKKKGAHVFKDLRIQCLI